MLADLRRAEQERRRLEDEVRRCGEEARRWVAATEQASSAVRRINEEAQTVEREAERAEAQDSALERNGGDEPVSLWVTSGAKLSLAGIVEPPESTGRAFRLLMTPEGDPSLTFDAERQGDVRVMWRETPVLSVQSPVPEYLQDRVLDVDEGSGETQFVLRGHRAPIKVVLKAEAPPAAGRRR